MQLQHITQETCSCCGAEPTHESRTGKHCNGHYNESRTFACGLSIAFSPNFMREEETSPCSKDPDFIARQVRRKEAKDSLLAFAGTLDVDEEFKANVKDRLQWLPA